MPVGNSSNSSGTSSKRSLFHWTLLKRAELKIQIQFKVLNGAINYGVWRVTKAKLRHSCRRVERKIETKKEKHSIHVFSIVLVRQFNLNFIGFGIGYSPIFKYDEIRNYLCYTCEWSVYTIGPAGLNLPAKLDDELVKLLPRLVRGESESKSNIATTPFVSPPRPAMAAPIDLTSTHGVGSNAFSYRMPQTLFANIKFRVLFGELFIQ